MKLLARANMPWLMLFSRLGLFALIQGMLAFSLYIFGKSEPWESAASWWPFVVTITNLIGLFLLIQLFRMEENFTGEFSILIVKPSSGYLDYIRNISCC